MHVMFYFIYSNVMISGERKLTLFYSNFLCANFVAVAIIVQRTPIDAVNFLDRNIYTVAHLSGLTPFDFRFAAARSTSLRGTSSASAISAVLITV